jgi:hypothetical protein
MFWGIAVQHPHIYYHDKNMQSLNYIPGSNFLGIVAEKYSELTSDAYDIFHSGKVSFGDAHISKDNCVSYHLPFSLFLDKLNNDITKEKMITKALIKTDISEK